MEIHIESIKIIGIPDELAARVLSALKIGNVKISEGESKPQAAEKKPMRIIDCGNGIQVRSRASSVGVSSQNIARAMKTSQKQVAAAAKAIGAVNIGASSHPIYRDEYAPRIVERILAEQNK